MNSSTAPQSQRKFRFAIQCNKPMSHVEVLDTAQKAEDMGYSAITVPDHLDGQLGPIALLATIAANTTELRIGTLMFCNDYRHPAFLAKEIATLDQLSNGRFELGIGAGWMTSDYEQAGLTLDSAGTRIERMIEGIEVMQGLFADGPFTYAGEHYQIAGLQGAPKPTQVTGPPIVIGGGAPRMLRTAGRLADIVGLNLNLRSGVIDAETGADGTVAQTTKKLAWVAEGAGERFADIELQTRVHFTSVTDDRETLAEALAAGFGLTSEEALASPHTLVGTVDQMAEDLLVQRETLGITYIGVSSDNLHELAPVVAKLTGA